MGHLSETVVDSAAAMRNGFSNIFTKGADLATSFGGSISDTSVELIETVRKSIKRNPMIAVGIAFAGGLLIGGAALFLARRGVKAVAAAAPEHMAD